MLPSATPLTLVNVVFLVYGVYQMMSSDYDWLPAIGYSLCAPASLTCSPHSLCWRVFSAVSLLSVSMLSLFLLFTLSSLASIPGIDLVEVSRLLPLGTATLLCVSQRLAYRTPGAPLLQSILLYSIAGISAMTIFYSVAEYYLPNLVLLLNS